MTILCRSLPGFAAILVPAAAMFAILGMLARHHMARRAGTQIRPSHSSPLATPPASLKVRAQTARECRAVPVCK